MQMNQSRVGGSVRVAVLSAIAALALGVAVASAASADDQAGFITSGEVESTIDSDGEFFEPDTPYITVEVSDAYTGAYIATWERRVGIWASPAEAEVYLASGWSQRSQCVVESARAYVAGANIADGAAFDARWGTGDSTWNFAPAEWAAINANCPQNEWDWTRSATEDDPGPTFFVHIPVDVLGAGEHELFIMPIETNARVVDGTGDPACIVAEFADGQAYWLNDCFYEGADTPITTTITVVDTPASPTTAPTVAPTPEPTASAEPPAAAQTPQAVAPVNSGAQDWTPLWWSIGIGAIVLVGVVVLLALFSRRRSSNGSVQLSPSGYPIPVSPPPFGQPAPQVPPGAYGQPHSQFPPAPPTGYGQPGPAVPPPNQPPGTPPMPVPPGPPPAPSPAQSPQSGREPYGLPGPYSAASPHGRPVPPPPPVPPQPRAPQTDPEPDTAPDPQTPAD